jgi:L-lysine 6-transaminase
VEGLRELAVECPKVSAVRGRGLFIAFDLPEPQLRDQIWKELYDHGLLVLKSGERAIRFRPALDIPGEVIDEALTILTAECRRLCR